MGGRRRRLPSLLLLPLHVVGIRVHPAISPAFLPPIPPSSSPSLPRAAPGGSGDFGGDTIHIELVSTTERALDVLMFRNVSALPASSHASRAQMQGATLTGDEDEAHRTSLASRHAAAIQRVLSPCRVQFVAFFKDVAKTAVGRGAVVGAIDAEFLRGARGLTFELPPRLHVANLRVDESVRRRGIGTALLSAVVRHAKKHPEATAVTLKVEEWNDEARRLYEREGFVCTEEVYAGFMCKMLGEGEKAQ